MKPVVAAAVVAAEAAEAAEAALVVAAGVALALAAVAAEAALAAEGAEAAEAALEAAGLVGESALDLPAAAVARRGEVAAGAKLNLLLELKNAGRIGRVRQGRPGQLMSSLRCPRAKAGSP